MEAKSSSEGSMTKDDVDVMVDIGYGRDRPSSQLSGAVGYSGASTVLNKKGQEKLQDMTVSGLNHTFHQGDNYEDVDQEDPKLQQPPQEDPKFNGEYKNEYEMLYKINKFFLDARTFFCGGEAQQAFAAMKIIRFGKLAVPADKFHKIIKPLILENAGKFQKIVGNNPDILIKGEKIFLTGTKMGPFKGKTFETALKVSDYF